MKAALLARVKRANLVEKEHSGFIIVTGRNKIISRIGNCNDKPFFLRSCAKPFQALPIITSGAYDRFNFTLRELAVCCASHLGTQEHTRTIQEVLNRIGLSEGSLLCGIHEPIDIETRNYLIKHSLNPSPLHNNCSGKHAGMLSVCVNNGWNIKSYLDFNHPVQLEILDIIKRFCLLKGSIEASVDGCSAPIYGVSLHKAALGYINLFLGNEGELIRKAFVENPVLIGGKGRLDSLITEFSKGRLVSKVGAEGLCVVVNLESEEALIVKIMDANIFIRSLVVMEALKQLGWLKEINAENLNTGVKTLNGTLVGEVEFAFQV